MTNNAHLINTTVAAATQRATLPSLFALFVLLLLQKYVSDSSSLVPAATKLGTFEDIRRLLLLLLLLRRRGALPLAAQGHLVVVLLPELFCEAVVGGGVCAGG